MNVVFVELWFFFPHNLNGVMVIYTPATDISLQLSTVLVSAFAFALKVTVFIATSSGTVGTIKATTCFIVCVLVEALSQTSW